MPLKITEIKKTLSDRTSRFMNMTGWSLLMMFLPGLKKEVIKTKVKEKGTMNNRQTVKQIIIFLNKWLETKNKLQIKCQLRIAYIYKTAPARKAQETLGRRWTERLKGPEHQGVPWEIVSLRNVMHKLHPATIDGIISEDHLWEGRKTQTHGLCSTL